MVPQPPALERVIGKEHDWLSTGRHLNGADGRALAGRPPCELSHERQIASEADTDAIGLRRDLPVLATQQIK